MMGRRWIGYRQAYSPSNWPLLPTVLLAMAVVLIFDLPWWASFAIAAVIGVVAANLTWWLWRRRHPPLSAQTLLERQREAAPWN